MSAASLVPLSALTAKGLVRAALESPTLAGKRRVDYKQLATKRWLTKCQPTRVPFDWTLNPYRGCEFACQYCYARYTHEFLERHDPHAFETEIFIKEWNERLFRQELARVPKDGVIAVGTATDPYQPAERKFGITRKVLEVFAGESGRRFGIISKSDLIARDRDLFLAIRERNHLHISVTITTLDVELARRLEPFAPRPDLRMEAVRTMSEAGLEVSVTASPLLPGITDTEENLQQLAQAAKDAGAVSFGAGLLFLKPCSRRVFLPWLREERPELVSLYERLYGRRDFLPRAEGDRVNEQIRAARERVGLLRKPVYREEFKKEEGVRQLSLFA